MKKSRLPCCSSPLPKRALSMVAAIFRLTPAFALAFSACEKKPRAADETSTLSPPVPMASALAPNRPRSELRTRETAHLGETIDHFEQAPSPETAAQVQKAFADLDSEIAELQLRATRVIGADQSETTAKYSALSVYRAQEALRFAQAQAANPQSTLRPSANMPTSKPTTAVEDLEHTAQETGRSIERGAKKTGEAIKDALH
jgi:hypothetical protein